MTWPLRRLIATKEGSWITIPRPFEKTSVFAVPRSTPKSFENCPAKGHAIRPILGTVHDNGQDVLLIQKSIQFLEQFKQYSCNSISTSIYLIYLVIFKVLNIYNRHLLIRCAPKLAYNQNFSSGKMPFYIRYNSPIVYVILSSFLLAEVVENILFK